MILATLLQALHRLEANADADVDAHARGLVSFLAENARHRAGSRASEERFSDLFVVGRTLLHDFVLDGRVGAAFFLENGPREFFVDIAVKLPVLASDGG